MFFDTETTGKPLDWKLPMTVVDNWPRVIQLGWSVCDLAGQQLSEGNYLIEPAGWEVPTEKFWIEHNLSTERCQAEGKPLDKVLGLFLRDLQSATFLVSHNMDFDYNVLGAELIRRGFRSEHRPTRVCTKELTTEVCRIPFHAKQRWYPGRPKQRYKWPKLEELHQFLFGTMPQNQHDAGGDVTTLRNCFFELVRRGIFVLPNQATT